MFLSLATKTHKHMNTHRITITLVSLLVIGLGFTSCGPPKNIFAGGGCGFTNFSGDDGSSWSTGSRLDLFTAVDFDLTDKAGFPLRFQPTLSLEKRGADYEDTFNNGSMSYTFSEKLKLSYIYVAPEFNTDIIPEKLEFALAPQFGFLVNAISDTESMGESEKQDVKEFYEDFDLGVRGGVRYNFTDRFGVGVNYYQGFSNVQSDIEAKNNGFNVRLEYKIKGL